MFNSKKIRTTFLLVSCFFLLNMSSTVFAKTEKGPITLKDGDTLKNTTIDGGTFGVIVKSGASVKLDNVTIKNTTDAGIITSGGGKLTVINSKITKNRKGFYIQPGKKVVITNTLVTDNREEGIDIRADVSGSITNNTITKNGESGIEVIVGESDLIIKNNTLSHNGASGIALQYYKESKKTGNLFIEENRLIGNKSYGFNCTAPQGARPNREYWKKSIIIKGNTSADNKDANQASPCLFLIELTDEQIKKQEEVEIKAKEEKRLAEEKRVEEERLVEEKRVREEQVQVFISRIDSEIEKSKKNIHEQENILKMQNKFMRFFSGPNAQAMQVLSDNLSTVAALMREQEKIKSMTDNDAMKEKLGDIQLALEEVYQKNQEIIIQYKDFFSLRSLWNNIQRK